MEYNDHFEYEMPVAGGETPIATDVFDPDMFDEPFGEFPGTDLEHLVR